PDKIVGCGNGVGYAGRFLKRASRQQPCGSAFRVGVIVAVEDLTAILDGQQHDASGTQCNVTGCAVQRLDQKTLLGRERLRQPRRGDTHLYHFRRPVTEGDAESAREQNRKDEHPEYGLRLAPELASADQSELNKRIVREGSFVLVRHRADAS